MNSTSGLYETSPAHAVPLPRVVDAIGSTQFGCQLLSHVRSLCGAEYAAVYRFAGDMMDQLAGGKCTGLELPKKQLSTYLQGGYWRKDPALPDAQRHLSGSRACAVLHQEIDALPDIDFRRSVYPRMRDRLVICGRRGDSIVLLSLLRSESRGCFSQSEISQVEHCGELLVSLILKHADVMARQTSYSRALSSTPVIERILTDRTSLSPREAGVCSRILHGIPISGIALDLSISDETVKTYRKRAYQRLGIGSKHELLSIYLGFAADGDEPGHGAELLH